MLDICKTTEYYSFQMQVLAGLKRTDGWLTKDAGTKILEQTTKV